MLPYICIMYPEHNNESTAKGFAKKLYQKHISLLSAVMYEVGVTTQKQNILKAKVMKVKTICICIVRSLMRIQEVSLGEISPC